MNDKVYGWNSAEMDGFVSCPTADYTTIRIPE